ncbi:MAG: ACT domain-containing protein [Kiritimatiellae bacterium]|nr:ACT domain-containing protein [Kiritimatiellia bacterium]
MQIRQISIFLENRPGQLSQICRALSEADINIATLSLADTSDFGIVRMIVDDHEKARDVLISAGHAMKVSEVVAVCVPDSPGGMAGVTAVLDEAGANIEYSYAFSFHKGEKAVLVFRFSDNQIALEALAKAGYVTLAEQDVIKEGVLS